MTADYTDKEFHSDNVDDYINEETRRFLDFLGYKLREKRTYTLDIDRLEEVKIAYEMIREIVLNISPDAKIYCKPHEVDESQSVIRVEVDELIVEDIKAFIQGIQYADNFEIYPIKGGKMRIAIMFHGVMKELKR